MEEAFEESAEEVVFYIAEHLSVRTAETRARIKNAVEELGTIAALEYLREARKIAGSGAAIPGVATRVFLRLVRDHAC